MEPAVGIEPTTDGLQNRCSTAELSWRWGGTFADLNVPCRDWQWGAVYGNVWLNQVLFYFCSCLILRFLNSTPVP